jgi:predicted phosphodiesterase
MRRKEIFNNELYSQIATIYLTNEIEGIYTSAESVAKNLNIPLRTAERYIFVLENKDNLALHTDEQLRGILNKTVAKLQRYMDTNNMLRKSERENVRTFNAVEALNEEVIKLLRNNPLRTSNYEKISPVQIKNIQKGGLIQCSDWHGNELIFLPGINTFDFSELSRKVQKHFYLSKVDFLRKKIKHVLVAITGDLLNSDRRLSEKLHMATNRTKASLLTANILASALIDLARHFRVYVIFVSGNESRVNEEYGFEELLMTDNYDFTICNFAKEITKFHENIEWVQQQSYVEEVIQFAGKNFLVIHGDARILQGDVERGVLQLIGKWANQGIIIDFVILGHLHYTRVGDHFARSASMPGANAYSNRALQLITKSSQLSHEIIGPDIFTKRYDLDNTDGYVGYEFDKSLEAYNPKSLLKTKTGRPVITITAL